MFHQRWNLFAPEPPVSDMLVVYRYQSGDSISEWFEPAYIEAVKHHRNPFSYHGTVHRVHRHVMRNVLYTNSLIGKSGATKKEAWMKLSTSQSYKLAGRYALDVSKMNGFQSVDAYQICYIGRFPSVVDGRLEMRYELYKFPWKTI